MELNNLKNESNKLRLTPQEKAAMKARIFEVPSPATLAPRQSPYFLFAYQFMQARVLAPLAVVLVVFAGAGTAAAAQGSLPGDALYPVKVSVNEAVEVALATTPVAKAQVQAKLAQRRVEEAEVLAAQGTLTPDTSEQLAANFETHAQAAAELTDDVAEVDPDTGASLEANLDSSLAAHSAILATLGQDDASSSDDGADSESLATRVLARADAGRAPKAAKAVTLSAPAPEARMAAQPAAFSAEVATSDASTTEDDGVAAEESAPAADPAQESVARKLMARAQDAIVYARANFNDTKDDLDATTSAQVADKLSEIDALMVAGGAALDAHEYAQAEAEFTEALGASIKLSTVLIAQQKIPRNIVAPILRGHLIINADDDGTSSVRGPEILQAL
jgi:hypothetical protein